MTPVDDENIGRKGLEIATRMKAPGFAVGLRNNPYFYQTEHFSEGNILPRAIPRQSRGLKLSWDLKGLWI